MTTTRPLRPEILALFPDLARHYAQEEEAATMPDSPGPSPELSLVEQALTDLLDRDLGLRPTDGSEADHQSHLRARLAREAGERGLLDVQKNLAGRELQEN